MILLLLGVSGVASAAPFSVPKEDCEGKGGKWRGGDPNTGYCSFPKDHDFSVVRCIPRNEYYAIVYTDGEKSGEFCKDPDVVDWQLVQFLLLVKSYQRREVVQGPLSGDETLQINTYKFVRVNFPRESCPQKCSLDVNLPRAADEALPDDAKSTAYVRLVGEDGEPHRGKYTICFTFTSGKIPTIYRFVSGRWQALFSYIRQNEICTLTINDGSYYLGEK
jgi:hypothetical protein